MGQRALPCGGTVSRRWRARGSRLGLDNCASPFYKHVTTTASCSTNRVVLSLVVIALARWPIATEFAKQAPSLSDRVAVGCLPMVGEG
jgi:hypothetical protein